MKAPELIADSTENIVGKTIEIEFSDQPDWRKAVAKVSLSGRELEAGKSYVLSPGILTIAAGEFENKGEYEVTVQATGYPDAAVVQPIGIWRLSWQDEFNGGAGGHFDSNGLDLCKWAYQEGTGSQYGLTDWGNNEAQYYSRSNVRVEDGRLVLTARVERLDGKPYTSGRLCTYPAFAQTYGRFEAKISMPAIDGLWPAFWMMPKNSEYGGWAASGEIDIMEVKGRLPGESSGAIHFGGSWPDNRFAAADYRFPTGEDITGWHVYAVEWEPGEIRWYVDDILFQRVNNWSSVGRASGEGMNEPTPNAYPAPFDKDFYLILNLAVGGNFDNGVMPPAGALPAEMKVDYVRAYELDGIAYRTPKAPR